MTKERSAALTTVLVLTALAWGIVRRSADSRDREFSTDVPADNPPAAEPIAPAAWDAATDSGPGPFPVTSGNAALATAWPREVAADSKTARPATPGTLPTPKKVSPLFPPIDNTAQLKAIIRKYVPNATPQQIRVWERQLKGMPLHQARDLLELRQRFPLRGSDASPKIAPTPPPAIAKPDRIRETPQPRAKSQPSTVALPEPLRRSFDALRRSRDVLMDNLANARTPGFKRSRVVLANADAAATGGAKVAAVQRDWSAGRLIATGRELDVAIRSAGFFVLTDGRRRVFTRCGNFEWDSKGRLSLAGTAGRYRVESAVTVRLSGFESGTAPPRLLASVSGKPQPSVTEPLPFLTTATFRNPDGLKAIGGNLFEATTASGPPILRHSTTGRDEILKSGCLEASNVDLDRELAELATVAEHMLALRSAARMFESIDATPSAPRLASPPAKMRRGRRILSR